MEEAESMMFLVLSHLCAFWLNQLSLTWIMPSLCSVRFCCLNFQFFKCGDQDGSFGGTSYWRRKITLERQQIKHKSEICLALGS